MAEILSIIDDLGSFCKITSAGVAWLVENYHKTTTRECADFLGINKSTLANYAYRLNLVKSKEHIASIRRQQAINTNIKRWKK